METLYGLIDNYNWPILSAFAIGILMSISPCPLATNITAIAYISKKIKSPRHVIFSGLFYTLGRTITYVVLSLLIYFGLSSFQISRVFQGWGDKVLGPVLIILGLIMFNLIKLNFNSNNDFIAKLKLWLSSQGYLGSLLLGILFALAFCPYSGVLFFGMLVPLILQSNSVLILPLVFSLGTGLPVIIFAFLIAFSLNYLSRAFKVVQKIEKVMRYFVATVFIISGLYYSQFLIKYLFNLLLK